MAERALSADQVLDAALALLDEVGLRRFTMRALADRLSVTDRLRRRGRGLRLVATDIEWSTGEGPEVCGPGEAVLLALAGRGVAIDDLRGPGVSVLAARVRAPLPAAV
jgi:hypothetical protein